MFFTIGTELLATVEGFRVTATVHLIASGDSTTDNLVMGRMSGGNQLELFRYTLALTKGLASQAIFY